MAKERKQDDFIKLYRDLIYAIGLDNAIVLGQLISCDEMFEKMFYQQQNRIAIYTGLSKRRVNKALKVLEQLDLIIVDRARAMNKNMYMVNTSAIDLIHKKHKELGYEGLYSGWYLDANNRQNIINDIESTYNFDTTKETNEETNKIIESSTPKQSKITIFKDNKLNIKLQNFFNKVNKDERKEIYELLNKNIKVSIVISLYLELFNRIKYNCKLKKPNSSLIAIELINNIENILNNTSEFDIPDYDTFQKVIIRVWQWLLSNNEVQGNYAIFMFVDTDNWFINAFHNIEEELYEEGIY